MVEFSTNILTLIPKGDTYGVTVLILLIFSCFTLSTFIYAKWFQESSFTLIDINMWVKGLVCLYGALFVPIYDLVYHSLPLCLLSILLGLAIGFLYINVEINISRMMNRKALSKSTQHTSPMTDSIPLKTLKRRNLFTQKKEESKVHQGFFEQKFDFTRSLTSLIFVALFEEILFRGFLFKLILIQPSLMLRMAMVIGCSIIFGINHFQIGKYQLLSKTVFSLLMYLSCIVTGNFLAAIVSHITLNVFAYRFAKNQTVVFAHGQ